MYKVIDYYDLRPVDWMSGKRMPLGPGEGHVCDRCEAEHAVVYVVQDLDTGKTYRVGSSCAKASFGFEINENREAKAIVKTRKQQAAAELDVRRQKEIEEYASKLAAEVSNLPIPACMPDGISYRHAKAWRCGDGLALAALGRSDAEAQDLAIRGWVENRLRERIPREWDAIYVLYRPDRHDKTTISMARKVLAVAASKI